MDLARQSRAMVLAWWNFVSSGLIARQMEEQEEERKKNRAGTGSLCNLARQSH